MWSPGTCIQANQLGYDASTRKYVKNRIEVLRLMLAACCDPPVAELEFNWDRQWISVRILGHEGQELLHQDWSFEQLTRTTTASAIVQERDLDSAQQKLEDYSILQNDEGDWICVNYRGHPGSMHFALGVFSTAVLLVGLGIAPMILCLLGGRAVFEENKNCITERVDINFLLYVSLSVDSSLCCFLSC